MPAKIVLDKLSRVPLRCPLEQCAATISWLDLLAHVKEQHYPATDQFHVAFEGERCNLVFDPVRLIPRETICLGVLLFAGERGEVGKLPGQQGICHRNRGLKDSGLQNMEDHQPVLILLRKCAFFEWLMQDKDVQNNDEFQWSCQQEFPNQQNPERPEYLDFKREEHPTSSRDCQKTKRSNDCGNPNTGKVRLKRTVYQDFRAEAGPKSKNEDHCNSNRKKGKGQKIDETPNPIKDQKGDTSDSEEDRNKKTTDPEDLEMYLIWTQSVPSVRPLYVAITVYDNTMSEGRSVLRLVTNSGKARPELFDKQLPKAQHSLWLTEKEMQQLCGKQHKVHLEMILNERLEETK